MKRIFTVLALALASLIAVPVAHAQNISARLAAEEARPVALIASNALTAQIDFTPGIYNTWASNQFNSTIPAVGSDYRVANLNTNIALQVTNMTPNVERRIYINTDGTAHTFTLSTNGLTTQTRFSYTSAFATNGSGSVSVTNRARIGLINSPPGEIQVTVTHNN